MTSKRTLTRWAGLLATSAIVFAACSSDGGSSAAPSAATGGGMEELIAAAKAEGTLTTIALPDDWCNYREMIDTYKSKYGMEVNELDPNAGSNDELEAIKANKDNKGPQAPDVVDVGLSFGPQAKDEGLLAPYKVETWDTIPAEAKDPDGYWWGDYYGVLTFEVNTDVVENVPADWADLLKPEYKNMVALAGDPRTSNQAIQTVYAAALANGGSLDDAQPGLDFFKDLVAAGNFVPTIAKPGTIAQGETPITIRWNYNALSNKDALAGNPDIAVVVPTQGRFAGVYVQGISAYAPHPNAAKLWQEFMYSDEGQLIWMKGYCYPIRYEDLKANGKIPAEIGDKLPDVTGAVFPSLDQLNAAKDLITQQWDAVVGVDVVE
ncbi:MAG: ABC transporter substrate-binding protein [Chloroflexota bacterium]|nr:ABC transporter substrate-binding protein [Chloroflexota bacterium]MDH5243728.1 ABC transporter substrate-binding protein [Chloroflexota bacterium]